MRSLVLLYFLSAVSGAAELEHFNLADGRSLVGEYDENNHILSVITSNGRIAISVLSQQILSRSPYLEAPHSPGVSALPVQDTVVKTTTEATPNKYPSLEELIALYKVQSDKAEILIKQERQIIEQSQGGLIDNRISELEGKISNATLDLRVETDNDKKSEITGKLNEYEVKLKALIAIRDDTNKKIAIVRDKENGILDELRELDKIWKQAKYPDRPPTAGRFMAIGAGGFAK
jgi:hypothetical protein